jgi:hypothetical protein
MGGTENPLLSKFTACEALSSRTMVDICCPQPQPIKAPPVPIGYSFFFRNNDRIVTYSEEDGSGVPSVGAPSCSSLASLSGAAGGDAVTLALPARTERTCCCRCWLQSSAHHWRLCLLGYSCRIVPHRRCHRSGCLGTCAPLSVASIVFVAVRFDGTEHVAALPKAVWVGRHQSCVEP